MPLGSYQEAVRQPDKGRIALQALPQPALLLIAALQGPGVFVIQLVEGALGVMPILGDPPVRFGLPMPSV